MVFCGQCGLQLAPGDTRCPRCGAEVDPNATAAATDFHPNDPTVQSPSLLATQRQAAPGNQQRLVLRPSQDENNYDYSTQRVSEAANGAGVPGLSSSATRGAPYPGYAPPTTPAPDGSYPPQRMSYAGYVPQGGTLPAPPDQVRRRHSKGRTAGLLIILLGLLLILSAMVLFAMSHRGTHASTNGGGTGVSGGTGATVTAVSTPQLSQAETQAQAVIQQYYSDVNQHDYRAAYNLRTDLEKKETFPAFRNGYKNTVQDQVTFGQTTTRADGSVKVFLTIQATEAAASGGGTQQTIYKGYYIVGQQSDGTWKIVGGYLARA